MSLENRTEFREVGSAFQRYSSPEDVTFREHVRLAIDERARKLKVQFRLTGSPGLLKRAEGLERTAFRYRYCSYEYIRLVCTKCKRVLLGPARCECRICPSCAKKYYARIYERLHKMLSSLRNDGKRRLMLLTLTIQTDPHRELCSNDVRRLFKQGRKLINKLYRAKDGCGGIAVVELGSNGNLHLHVLVYGNYVPQDTISELWHELTEDSFVVDIRKIASPRRQLGYVLKYIYSPCKSDSPEDVALYLDIMTGVRRIHTFGVFYNSKMTRDNPCPCPLCGGELEFVSIDGGYCIPANALFFEEAREIVRAA